MDAAAPSPRDTMMMTAATPMMTPSMVSRLRIRLRRSALEAMRIDMKSFFIG